AFAAGAGLGVLEQLVLWNWNVPSAADVVFLAVILLGLLARRERAGQPAEESSSWTDTAVARPVPAELRHLPEVPLARGGVTALLVGLPALRIRGLFLAVTTLAFAIALDSYFLNPTYFSRWIPDALARPILWQRFPLEHARTMYYLCLAVLGLFVLAARGVR